MGQARRFVSGETPYRDGKVRQSSDVTRIAEGSGGPTQETSAQALAGPRVVCSLTKQPGVDRSPQSQLRGEAISGFLLWRRRPASLGAPVPPVL